MLVAAALLVLTGMAAIAIDGGLAYNERRSTQNAADNAALAGAWALCRGEDAAQAALDSAQLNGYTPPQVDAPQIDGDTVTVRIQADISTTFGRAQGVGELGVISEARARCTLGGGGGEWLGLPAILSVGSGCGPVTLGNNGDSNGLIYSASGLVLKNNNDIHGPVYTEGDLVVQNNVELYGPVHSNANLTINNNAKHHHPSNATYVGTLTKGNNTSTWDPVRVPANPPLITDHPFDLADYRPGGSAAVAAQAAGKYHHVETDLIIPNNGDISPGLYYVEGKVTMGNNVDGAQVTIVAEKQIIVGNNLDLSSPYVDNLLLASAFGGGNCSSSPAIEIPNNADLGGSLYAPNGVIDMNNNSELPGVVMALRVEIKNNAEVLGDGDLWHGTDPEVVLEG